MQRSFTNNTRRQRTVSFVGGEGHFMLPGQVVISTLEPSRLDNGIDVKELPDGPLGEPKAIVSKHSRRTKSRKNIIGEE